MEGGAGAAPRGAQRHAEMCDGDGGAGGGRCGGGASGCAAGITVEAAQWGRARMVRTVVGTVAGARLVDALNSII